MPGGGLAEATAKNGSKQLQMEIQKRLLIMNTSTNVPVDYSYMQKQRLLALP